MSISFKFIHLRAYDDTHPNFLPILIVLNNLGLRVCQSEENPSKEIIKSTECFDVKKFIITEQEWKERLTPEQFRILRENGTEPAFKNAYWDNEKKGLYVCAGCALSLYTSDTKDLCQA